jgi:hypothetical protein
MAFIILERWAEELSARLGRTADEIRQNRLSDTDFPNESLELRFYDGSYAILNKAFFLFNIERRMVAVFARHCGYFEIPITWATIRTFPYVEYWSGMDVLKQHLNELESRANTSEAKVESEDNKS